MNDHDHNDDQRQLAAAQSLPPDMMLLKMENESIMAIARTSPRDPMKIVKQLKELIDAYPAAADEAIYSKPVGTVFEIRCAECGIKYEVVKIENDTACPNCDCRDRNGNPRRVKKFAEGLSIRAAESIRSIYGYTRLSTTTELLPDGNARLTGVLVDYAAGNMTSDERIVSRHYKARGGGMVEIAEDRFLNITVKAEKSKLRRDVILDNTPNIVKALFRDECEKKLLALVSPELIEQKVIPAFAQYGVTLDHLEKIIGKPFKLGWTEEDRLSLRKILSALKNEETTARELLADLDDARQTPGGKVAVDPLNEKLAASQAAKAAKGNGAPKPEEKPATKPAPNPDSEPGEFSDEAISAAELLIDLKAQAVELECPADQVQRFAETAAASKDPQGYLLKKPWARGQRGNKPGDQLFEKSANAQES